MKCFNFYSEIWGGGVGELMFEKKEKCVKKQDSNTAGEMEIWQSGKTLNLHIHMKIFEK